MSTQQDVIKALMKSLNETSDLDINWTPKYATNKAFKFASSGKYNSMQEVIDAFLVDCKNAESVDQFLREKCGIILDNEDNGSITGLDAGGSKIKTDETVVPETNEVKRLDTQYLNKWDKWTAGEEVPLDNGNATVDKSGTLYFEKLGLTVKVPDYDKIIETANGSDKTKREEAQRKLIVINGLYSWWIEEAIKLNIESYGDNFGFNSTSKPNARKMTVEWLYDEKDSRLAQTDPLFSNITSLDISSIILSINIGKLKNISLDSLNGKSTEEYLDCTIAHEFTHAIMDSHLDYLTNKSLPKILKEGLSEITKGTDNYRGKSIAFIVSEYKESNDSENTILGKVSNGAYKTTALDKGDLYRGQYCFGYMLLRYFVKQCATEDPAINIGANQSLTCTLEEGLLVKANNGTATLQKGDALVTDSYGNITIIKIGNENNIISTPESKSMVVVKNHSGKNIASIFGSASVHDNGFIQKNFSAIEVKSDLDNATIVGGNDDDYVSVNGNNLYISTNADYSGIGFKHNISGKGDNLTVLGSHGEDLIIITGDNASINGISGEDTVVVEGNNASVFFKYENDEVAYGSKKVTITGSNAKIRTNKNSKSEIFISGSNNEVINEDEVSSRSDSFTIATGALNNTIINFDSNAPLEQDNVSYDVLLFEGGEIAAEIQTLDGTESVVISSATTGETLVVLAGVISGSNNNITYRKDDGGTMTTSIDWLLSNTTPINPNPDDTEVIDVPVNGNVNNTRDDVIINAVSGNNVIQNSGSNVRITGGTDKDEVTNLGDNVVIEGNSGNDIILNGEESSSTSQPTKGGDNVVINGGAGLDLIYNYGGLNVQLNGAEGADTLYNSGSNTTITGGDGDDSINNENASEVTISGGNGKDTISNISENVSIDGGDGIDFIYNGNYSISGGSNVSISGGEDNDYISNWDGSKLSISGGAGNDYIFNNGTNVTMLGDAGDDTITNRGTNSTIYSGDGKDSIENRGNYTSIDMGEGDNRIWNMGTNTTIHSGTGDDTVHNGGAESHDAEDVKIDIGAGNDSIHNIRDNVTIDAGADNDLIYNDGDNVFVVGNTGDDTIRSELSHNVTINSGDGNDSINNNSSETTIDAGDGDDNITINASDVLIDAGAGKDSIFLSNAYRGTVNSGTGNDYIETYGRSAFIKINTGDGDDSIRNTASETTIISGTGDDSIDNDGSNVTIDTGDGNDIIYNDDENVSISSGNGNDTIIAFTGDHTTINAGAGNDSIYLGSSRLERQTVIQYNSGDGHDTIHQFYLTSTLNITGEAYSTQRSGNDIIVRVGNGSITLKDIQGFTPNIQNTFNDDDTQSGGDDTQSGGNDTQSGGNDTQSGGDDTQSGGQDQTDTVRIVKNIVGLDLNYLDKVVVTDLDSLDDLIDERTVWLNFSSDSGDGFQNIDLSKSDYRQVISLEGGNQKVTFNDTDRNVAIVGASATGSKEIIFGNGNDLGIFLSPKADIKTTVGSGNDSIITDNNARVRADMTKADNAQIIPYSGRVILDNYDYESQAEIVLPEVTDITSAVKDNSIQFVGNEIRFDSSTVKIKNSAAGSTLVNLATENGDSQKVGFMGLNGGYLDTSSLKGNFLLKGNYAENSSDSQKHNGATIIAGGGNDTILAGSGDSVNGGGGENQIYLTPKELRKNEGATISISNHSRNTVKGFNAGFSYTSDVIQVDDLDNLQFKFDTDGLLFTADDARLKFDGIGTDTSTTEDTSNELGTDKAELIQLSDGSSNIKVAIARNGQSILVQEDDYQAPNAFFGNRSGLNFSDYRGDLNINLNDGSGTLDKFNATFHGINKLQAGTGMATLIGSNNRDTLIAGDGYSSLWGGKDNDKLIGRANSTDKDGRTTFFFFAGDGHDVIYDFNFSTTQNYYSGDTDKIDIGDCDINDAYCSGDDVILTLDDDSYLTIKDAKEKNFQINHMIAQVGNELHYDGIANTFVNNGNRNSSLIVDSNVRSAEIWLDSSHDALFFGHISTLDASAVEGRTSLVGNEFNNTIIAGQGDASLWGGFSPTDDLLIGGDSHNTFFYCNGNGHDTIQGINDGDSVILADISLDQITGTEIAANSVSINFVDGGSLRIDGTAKVTYQLADGSKYSASHERFEWNSK